MNEKSRLVLFADTNLLIQCRPLEQLPWQTVGPFHHIDVVLSRPVQAEIDQHKNKGNDRVAKRARTAAAIMRQIVLGTSDHIVIRDDRPQVKLSLDTRLRPDTTLVDRLDYLERDDELVGIVSEYIRRNPGTEVRLLTHDIGPMMSARMVDVPIQAIPDEWLLPPESSESEKKISALEQELARLKKVEPIFTISCVNEDDEPIDRIDIELVRHSPLTEDELSRVVSRLKMLLPMKSVGAHNVQTARTVLGEVFVPPSREEIAEYEREYREWLHTCTEALKRWHNVADHRSESQEMFRFVASNIGTRPANDALVEIEANGDFSLLSPVLKRSGRKKRQQDALPAPPKPPSGRWRGMLSSIASFGDFARMPNIPHFALQPLPPDRARDPNAFYWKPHRFTDPTKVLSLECAQWRHGIDAERFAGRFHIPQERSGASGLLTCSVHASNLSQAAHLALPVRVSVVMQSAEAVAIKAIDRLVASVSRVQGPVDEDRGD